MKQYTFRRKVICLEFGVVTANSKEEALKKIKESDYDDIFDQCFEEVIENSEEIEDESETSK